MAEFSKAISTVDEIGGILRTGSDLERILGRLRNRLVRPRELGGLRATVRGLPGIKDALLCLGDRYPSIQSLAAALDTFDELRELLDLLSRKSCHRRSRSASRGGAKVIKAGFDEEFDSRASSERRQKWIVDLEAREREKIGNLKVKYNGRSDILLK